MFSGLRKLLKQTVENEVGRSRTNSDNLDVGPEQDTFVFIRGDEGLGQSDSEHGLDTLQVMDSHTDIVRILLIIDHYRLASCGDDGTIRIWHIQLGACLHSFQGHSQRIFCLLHLSLPGWPNPNQLVSLSADKTLQFWDVDGLCRLYRVSLMSCEMRGQESARCLISLPSPGLLVSGGTYLKLWDTSGTLLDACGLDTEQNEIHGLYTVEHSQMCYVICTSGVFIDVLALHIEDKKVKLVHHAQLPQRRTLIRSLGIISEDCFAVGQDNGVLTFWSVPDFVLVDEVPHRSPPVGSKESSLITAVAQVAFFSKRLIFYAVGRKVIVYDKDFSMIITEIEDEEQKQNVVVTHFCFFQQLLVTCCADGVIRLWSLRPLISPDRVCVLPCPIKKVGECVGHSGSVEMAVSYPDGLISCGNDSLVIAWRDKWLTTARSKELALKWSSEHT